MPNGDGKAFPGGGPTLPATPRLKRAWPSLKIVKKKKKKKKKKHLIEGCEQSSKIILRESESCRMACNVPSGGDEGVEVFTSSNFPIKCIFLCRALIRPLLNLKRRHVSVQITRPRKN
jgi:hypothetical protein